jgi:hypothetical protein
MARSVVLEPENEEYLHPSALDTEPDPPSMALSVALLILALSATISELRSRRSRARRRFSPRARRILWAEGRSIVDLPGIMSKNIDSNKGKRRYG